MPPVSSDKLRDLLMTAFDNTAFDALCYDHFGGVYQDFSSGMGKGQKIQRLIEYVEQHLKVAELLALVKDRNRAQYNRFFPDGLPIPSTPAPKAPPADINSQLEALATRAAADDATRHANLRPATLPTASTVAWSASLPGKPAQFAGLAHRDGTVLVALNDGGNPPREAVLAWCDALSGAVRHTVALPGSLISGVAATETGFIVTTCATEPLTTKETVRVYGRDGHQQWLWESGASYVSAPVVVAEGVWVTTAGRRLVRLHLNTGAVEADISLGMQPAIAAPALTDDTAYIPSREGQLLAIGLDGQSRWHYHADTDGWLNQTPLVDSDRVVAVQQSSGQHPGRVIALRRTEGQVLWATPSDPPSRSMSQPAADAERIYVGTDKGLLALALDDGRVAWAFPTTRRIEAAPVVMDSIIYAVSHDRHLYAVDAATGKERWHFAVERRLITPPLVIASRRILILDRGSTLTALDGPISLADLEAAGEWQTLAEVHAGQNRYAEAATAFTQAGDSIRAAQAWQLADNLAQAAEQYETAESWADAAFLWGRMGRLKRQAEALEQYAKTLPSDDSALVSESWDIARQAWIALKDDDRADACHAQLAQYRELPYLTVTVRYDVLVLDAWDLITISVHNHGTAGAQRVLIQTDKSSGLEGDATKTRDMPFLAQDEVWSAALDVCPRQKGRNVPLRLTLTYSDTVGGEWRHQKTFYLPVVQTAPVDEAQATQTSYQDQLTAHRRCRAKLQEQQAKMGLHTPPHIIMEIEDITAQIAALEGRLTASPE